MSVKPPPPAPKALQGYELVVTASVAAREVGALLRGVRVSLGKQQQDVAELSGIAYQNLSRLENGKIEPMLGTMRRYLESLGWELALIVRPRTGFQPPPAHAEPSPEEKPGRATRSKSNRRKPAVKKRTKGA